jgi:hypothetical protein
VTTWLELEDIHEIQHDDEKQETIVWDIEGDERMRLVGLLSEELVHAIVRLCNRVYDSGRRVGRVEKAGEIWHALQEGRAQP